MPPASPRMGRPKLNTIGRSEAAQEVIALIPGREALWLQPGSLVQGDHSSLEAVEAAAPLTVPQLESEETVACTVTTTATHQSDDDDHLSDSVGDAYSSDEAGSGSPAASPPATQLVEKTSEDRRTGSPTLHPAGDVEVEDIPAGSEPDDTSAAGESGDTSEADETDDTSAAGDSDDITAASESEDTAEDGETEEDALGPDDVEILEAVSADGDEEALNVDAGIPEAVTKDEGLNSILGLNGPEAAVFRGSSEDDSDGGVDDIHGGGNDDDAAHAVHGESDDEAMHEAAAALIAAAHGAPRSLDLPVKRKRGRPPKPKHFSVAMGVVEAVAAGGGLVMRTSALLAVTPKSERPPNATLGMADGASDISAGAAGMAAGAAGMAEGVAEVAKSKPEGLLFGTTSVGAWGEYAADSQMDEQVYPPKRKLGRPPKRGRPPKPKPPLAVEVAVKSGSAIEDTPASTPGVGLTQEGPPKRKRGRPSKPKSPPAAEADAKVQGTDHAKNEGEGAAPPTSGLDLPHNGLLKPNRSGSREQQPPSADEAEVNTGGEGQEAVGKTDVGHPTPRAVLSVEPSQKRKRGRPPKPKPPPAAQTAVKATDGEKVTEGAGAHGVSSMSGADLEQGVPLKRKRGRPPKVQRGRPPTPKTPLLVKEDEQGAFLSVELVEGTEAEVPQPLFQQPLRQNVGAEIGSMQGEEQQQRQLEEQQQQHDQWQQPPPPQQQNDQQQQQDQRQQPSPPKQQNDQQQHHDQRQQPTPPEQQNEQQQQQDQRQQPTPPQQQNDQQQQQDQRQQPTPPQQQNEQQQEQQQPLAAMAHLALLLTARRPDRPPRKSKPRPLLTPPALPSPAPAAEPQAMDGTVKRKRGRPPKPKPAVGPHETQLGLSAPQAAKPKGRPTFKNKLEDDGEEDHLYDDDEFAMREEEVVQERDPDLMACEGQPPQSASGVAMLGGTPPKRKRGRPSKSKQKHNALSISAAGAAGERKAQDLTTGFVGSQGGMFIQARKRGRPPKLKMQLPVIGTAGVVVADAEAEKVADVAPVGEVEADAAFKSGEVEMEAAAIAYEKDEEAVEARVEEAGLQPLLTGMAAVLTSPEAVMRELGWQAPRTDPPALTASNDDERRPLIIPVSEPPKRKRGRPPKIKLPVSSEPAVKAAAVPAIQQHVSGQPQKQQDLILEQILDGSAHPAAPAPLKRPRGRPRKNSAGGTLGSSAPLKMMTMTNNMAFSASAVAERKMQQQPVMGALMVVVMAAAAAAAARPDAPGAMNFVKRKRGRPPKQPKQEPLQVGDLAGWPPATAPLAKPPVALVPKRRGRPPKKPHPEVVNLETREIGVGVGASLAATPLKPPGSMNDVSPVQEGLPTSSGRSPGRP